MKRYYESSVLPKNKIKMVGEQLYTLVPDTVDWGDQ